MESNSPNPAGEQSQSLGEMEIHLPVTEDPSSSTLWDWGDLLDFALDDEFPISFDSVDAPQVNQTETQVPDRVRKRDPRLTCSNFLAGRVPCACPEIDKQLAEEEAAMPGKKRVRVARTGTGAARCQVPGCEADISELKGYHKRHRVCLRCANASTVVLDGQTKRYCQQCGKFHILSDFDEGKRSCRRKLERHNNRRRRKPLDSKRYQGDLQTEDTVCDGEAARDALCSNSQTVEKQALVELEGGHVSALHSDPNYQNVNSDSGVSFAASGETQTDAVKDDSKFSLSPSHCNNKSAYSSLCPTGRISFKLYDWNPAEFPRRLRHQIFQWLASMPVELEGYIRPGCTILTSFIAMPTFMWEKLFEDPVSHVRELIVCQKVLSTKGPILVYLNNMIFHVMKDGTSIMKLDMERGTPRLHYVYPTFFEAGKAIEFVACGSNLLQPKFRFLVSFAGKYLKYEYVALLEGPNVDHQLYKIFIPHVEPNLFGPAFIEVENESGISNFIPVLIGNREICSEMKLIQQRFDTWLSLEGSHCEVSALRQMTFSELLVDIAWLIKEPPSESIKKIMMPPHFQRINCLLTVLLHHESTIILDKILQNLKVMMDKVEINSVFNGTSDADWRLLQKHVDYVSNILCRKLKENERLACCSGNPMLKEDCVSRSSFESGLPSIAPTSEDLEDRSNGNLGAIASTTSVVRSPLLNKEVVMNVNLIKERPSKLGSHYLSNGVLKSRPSIFVIAVVAVCFGVCAVLLHPHKVSKFAISVRQCLTEGF